jgi:AraC-like DNA-binding protein
LQYQHGTNRFLRYHAISRCVGGADDPMTRGFVAALEESATQQSLSEIALACVFTDRSNFTRVFARRVGSSPGA